MNYLYRMCVNKKKYCLYYKKENMKIINEQQ